MKKGLTLTELIIVILLFSIIVAFLGQAFVVGLRSWDSGKNRAGLRQEGNFALEKMTRETCLAASITTAAADQITFEADLDDDSSDETITFELSSNELIRTVGSIDTVLARNVQTFTLSYRDVNDSPMSLPSDVSNQAKRDTIRIVTIVLTLNDLDETTTLSTSVYCRNNPGP